MAEPARRSQDELEIGELFADRYQILEILGRGGMGAVYRARDLSLGEEIALKLLSFADSPTPISILRFRKEVKLARRVTHPNVARVYDIGEHLGKLYLTMELVNGPTLRVILRGERCFPAARVIEIGRALAAGLSAAHEVGVVHRDLKPTNILIDRSGRVVLTDFGIARGADDEHSLTTGVLGTPHYMAPEQASGGVIDARVDVYAMGLVLYEMITGERAEGTPEILVEAMRGHGAPPALISLALHCIQRDPDARPRSAAEVGQLLSTIAVVDAADGTGTRRRADLSASVSDTVAAVRVTTMKHHVHEADRDRAVAVLPFIYRGPKDSDYLGDVITDELVDVLCRTRGLRVLGSGATSKYRDARDPRAIGRDLGAFAIIDGTVQMVGQRVRLSVRLIDADSGVQLWSDHPDGTLVDLFAFQEAIARRIAEELRVEITTITHRGDAPVEAIEQYLCARRMVRRFDFATATAAVHGFDRCIGLAPGFTPALAGRAIASVRAWFFEASDDASVDWGGIARANVQSALESASDIAETHLAAGMLATQFGDFATAARALLKAVAIAPTYADAHDYLGLLECEAGQGESGERRLKLADQLEPTLLRPIATLARHYALHGRIDEANAALEALEQRGGTGPVVASINRTRLAGWRGDRETVARMAKDERFLRLATWQTMRLYAQAFLGAFTSDEVEQRLSSLLGVGNNARRLTLASQLAAEVFCGRGEIDLALVHVKRSAGLILIDVEWLDRCPILAPLRALPGFAEARMKVEARIEAIWTQ